MKSKVLLSGLAILVTAQAFAVTMVNPEDKKGKPYFEWNYSVNGTAYFEKQFAEEELTAMIQNEAPVACLIPHGHLSAKDCDVKLVDRSFAEYDVTCSKTFDVVDLRTRARHKLTVRAVSSMMDYDRFHLDALTLGAAMILPSFPSTYQTIQDYAFFRTRGTFEGLIGGFSCR